MNESDPGEEAGSPAAEPPVNRGSAGPSKGKVDAPEYLDETALQALIERARAGDEEAFGEVVRAHYGKVYAVIYRMVSQVDDARELTQMAWVKAWQRLASFKGEARFTTWMYRLAVNTAMDFLRQKGRRREVEYLDEQSDAVEAQRVLHASSADRPDHSLEKKEIQAAFEQALETLSPEHRAALWLREVEGLSYQEIAEATKSRMGTVMSRIFYARKALQARLGGFR